MKTIIIPMRYAFHMNGLVSSYYRCDLYNKYGNFEIYNGIQNLNNYDVIIYQKAYTKECLELSRKFKHKIQCFDFCGDAIYKKGYSGCVDDSHLIVERIIENMNFLYCSSWGIYKDLYTTYHKPVYLIHEFIDTSEFFKCKNYNKIDNSNISVIYFGLANTFKRQIPYVERILEYGFKFVEYTNKPLGYGTFKRYNHDNLYDEIINHDISLNFYGYMKPPLKTYISWLCGVPSIGSYSDIERYSQMYNRKREGLYRYNYVRKYCDIKRSINMLNSILNLYHS